MTAPDREREARELVEAALCGTCSCESDGPKLCTRVLKSRDSAWRAAIEGMRKPTHDSCCERVIRAIDGHCDCTHPGWNAALAALAERMGT